VLPDSLLEVRGDSDVELFEAAGEDVDVGEFADEGSFWILAAASRIQGSFASL